jgi:hypothetical protein
MPKIRAAAKKFGIEVSDGRSARRKPRHRAVPLVPEIRHFATDGLEVSDGDQAGSTATITGTPIVYDVPYRVVDQLGFIVCDDEWNEAMDQRTIRRFGNLLDVSAVTYPASPATSLEVAHRAALRLSVESRARLRRLDAQLRAGRTLNASNESLIRDAINMLHSVSVGDGSSMKDLLFPDHVQQAVEAGTGSPQDLGKGDVLPEEAVGEFDSDNDDDDDDDDKQMHVAQDNSDGMAAEPIIDPGEQIRSKPTTDLLTAVRERHGRRVSQQHQQSEDLVREAHRRILK